MSSPLLARSGFSLDRLASFLTIADAGGLSAAARGDAVRQSQLSRQLKELEEFFGVPLIERRRGVFRLTAAGRGLSEIARPALKRLEDFDRQCRAENTEVHLGAGESVLVWLVTPRLKSLLAGEPGLAFTLHNLQSEDITTRLRDGRLDFGILRWSPLPEGLLHVPLGKVEHTLFVPRAVVGRGPRASAARVLGRVPLALLEGSNTVTTALFEWAAANRVGLKVRLRCTSLVQAAAAVEQLRMAAVLPTWAESAFAPGRVTRVELGDLHSLNVPLGLVWSKRQVAVRPFLGALAEALAAALGS
jgi:DNA-binding transcriptional LysR family regulator